MLSSRISVQKNSCQGQALVEFCCIAMILVLILLGGAGYGLATYQMHMASDAMLGPVSNLEELANTKGQVSGSKLLGYANDAATSNMGGTALDKITMDTNKGIYVGTKRTLPISQWVPSMSIKVAQPIPAGFLNAISGGSAEQRSAQQAWVPGGSPILTPWQGGEVGGTPTSP